MVENAVIISIIITSKRNELFVVLKEKHFLIKLIWIFVIGCFLGCMMETILCYIQRGHFESRQGLIYGPFTPVYGVGAILCTLLVTFMKDKRSVFFAAMVVGGAFEYLASFFQEMIFGTISWDYSHYFMNIGGRTSLFHMICWGILGLLFASYIYPYLSKKIESFYSRGFIMITWIVTIFMIFNIIISTMAGIRQDERLKGIKATSVIQEFLDTYYPDDFMDMIYPNKKVAKKKP